tara:strand:- start:33 stop:986 length:954 start_codon:yes stop_codon:yes gene_type:complete
MIKKDVILIGCGLMSIEYYKVLESLNKNVEVIGRGNISAKKFEEKTKKEVYKKGLNNYLENFQVPKFAIVAVGINQLYEVVLILVKAGIKNILLEKPGDIDIENILRIRNFAEENKCQIWIGYNRRFNASILKLKDLIIKDGGISSLFFEFTEFSEKIKELNTPENIKNKWLIANSSHVIDLVFHLIGRPNPEKFFPIHRGGLGWHKASSIFVGSGESDKNIPFSYISDWNCPGRWGIKVMTQKKTYLLKPLEKLKFITRNHLDPIEYELDDTNDENFKPGLYLQCKSFLEETNDNLCSISEQIESFKYYYLIAGYY